MTQTPKGPFRPSRPPGALTGPPLNLRSCRGDATATYSPDDNKLRLYVLHRLDAETYARVRAAGFKWAPKQDLFVAPMWTPAREDLLVQLAGEIDDEDTALVDRAEQRAERFEGYSERRAADAEGARQAVEQISQRFEFGQPILVPRPTRNDHVWLGLSRADFVARRLRSFGYAPSSRLVIARNPRRQP